MRSPQRRGNRPPQAATARPASGPSPARAMLSAERRRRVVGVSWACRGRVADVSWACRGRVVDVSWTCRVRGAGRVADLRERVVHHIEVRPQLRVVRRQPSTIPPEYRIQYGFSPVGGVVAILPRTSLRAEYANLRAGGRSRAEYSEQRVNTRGTTPAEGSECRGTRPSTAEGASSRARVGVQECTNTSFPLLGTPAGGQTSGRLMDRAKAGAPPPRPPPSSRPPRRPPRPPRRPLCPAAEAAGCTLAPGPGKCAGSLPPPSVCLRRPSAGSSARRHSAAAQV